MHERKINKFIWIFLSFLIFGLCFPINDKAKAAEYENLTLNWKQNEFAESWNGTSSYLDGDGSIDNPFLIQNVSDMFFLSEQVNKGAESYENKFLKLTDGLDFSSNQAAKNLKL